MYAPDLAPWPPAPITGEIGRGVIPPVPAPAGVAAGHRVWALDPLDVEALWTVPGDATAPARAVASGFHGDAWAAELVDVDAGLVRWRDLASCNAPVVHVSADVVICADGAGAIALDTDDGHVRWRSHVPITGGTAGLVAAIDGAAVVVLDTRDGRELARAPVADLQGDTARAVCRDGDGFDVFTWSEAHAVRRIAIGRGGAAIAWSLVVGTPSAVDLTGASADACDATIVIATAGPGPDEETIVAVDRASGVVEGGPLTAYGHWPARDGSGAIEIAAARGIEQRTRRLADPRPVSDAQVGALVASRGARRLVRARGAGLVLLDGDTRTALAAPLGVGRAVLGDHFVVAGPWRGIRTDRDALRRYPIPRASREEGEPPRLAAVDDPTRYDHPDLRAPTNVDEAAAIAWQGVGVHAIATAQLDPAAPHLLYAVPTEDQPSQTIGAGLAAFDLRARRWLWHRPDACPPGTPLAIAVAPGPDVIVCAARAGLGNSGVRATQRRDGAPLWEYRGPVDTVIGAGDAIAIVAASRVTLVAAATGRQIDRFAADDGWMPRLALTDRGVLVDAERGAIVGRSIASGLLPRWAVRVRGTVVSIQPAGDRVAVVLADGECYLIDPDTGAARAAGGWTEGWRAPGGGDLVVVPAKDVEHREWRVAGFDTDGVLRFRTALAVEPDWAIGARGRAAGAALAVAWGPVLRHVALLEPAKGALRGLFTLPDRAVPGLVFATVVDGKPVAGAVLSHPLAVVTF